MSGRSARLASVMLALLVGAGCTSYRPIEVADLRQGARVRVTVAQPVALRLREITIDQATQVDAEAVGVRDGQLVLSALWVERAGGIVTPGEGWTVNLPVSAVSDLRERRPSWLRSAALAVGLVVGSTLGWNAFDVGGSSGENGGETGGNPL